MMSAKPHSPSFKVLAPLRPNALTAQRVALQSRVPAAVDLRRVVKNLQNCSLTRGAKVDSGCLATAQPVIRDRALPASVKWRFYCGVRSDVR